MAGGIKPVKEGDDLLQTGVGTNGERDASISAVVPFRPFGMNGHTVQVSTVAKHSQPILIKRAGDDHVGRQRPPPPFGQQPGLLGGLSHVVVLLQQLGSQTIALNTKRFIAAWVAEEQQQSQDGEDECPASRSQQDLFAFLQLHGAAPVADDFAGVTVDVFSAPLGYRTISRPHRAVGRCAGSGRTLRARAPCALVRGPACGRFSGRLRSAATDDALPASFPGSFSIITEALNRQAYGGTVLSSLLSPVLILLPAGARTPSSISAIVSNLRVKPSMSIWLPCGPVLIVSSLSMASLAGGIPRRVGNLVEPDRILLDPAVDVDKFQVRRLLLGRLLVEVFRAARFMLSTSDASR